MRTVMFAAAILATSACTLDMDTESTGEQRVETHNKLAANKLAANKLAANKLAANKLAANSLNSTRLNALEETSDILSTPSGREVYEYIVSCALDAGVTIEKANVQGLYNCTGAEETTESCQVGLVNDDNCIDGHCVYDGGLNLAPQWVDSRLGNTGEGWISACLLARVNVATTEVEISLRGRNPGLVVGSEEADLYSLEEGAFYGNVFTGDKKPIEWVACQGRDEGAFGDTGGLAIRDCAEENPANPGYTYCGFTYAGMCADYTDNGITETYACSGVDPATGYYSDCYDGSRLTAGKFGGYTRYRQVITVYASGE